MKREPTSNAPSASKGVTGSPRSEDPHIVHQLAGVAEPRRNRPAPPGNSPERRTPQVPPLSAFPVTNTVSVICILVFMLCHTIGFEQVHAWFHFPDMTDADQHWQLWRWISPALIHYTWLHIVFNVMWWFLLGRIIEFHHQSWRLLLLFFTAAIIPNLAQYLVTGVDFGGLSGVVYSLFGYVWVYGHLRPGEGLHVSMTVMVQILAWLVLGFSGWLDSWVMMANAAHLGGLLVGVFFAIYYATHPNADHT